MIRKSWSEFFDVRSQSFVHAPLDVTPDMLVEIDPAITAYAQDRLIYSHDNRIVLADSETHYEATPRLSRVNVFGRAYRTDAKLYLHRILASIVLEAADYLYRERQWNMLVFDGLRTVEGAFNLYNLATDEDLNAGLLALPGQSAHNKGLAVDCMFFDDDGREIEMGGHFDHTDMTTNSRLYNGDKISPAAKENRLIREAAFLRAALTQGLLIAPLRNEFWDDRLPENRADLWRVIDSVARVTHIPFTPGEARESWDYADFQQHWRDLFSKHAGKLEAVIGIKEPPNSEKPEFYHGNFHPAYDRDLVQSGKNLTEL